MWRRRLFALEEELWGECHFALANIVLQDSLSDSWLWLAYPNAGYSVGGAYHLLSHLVPRDVSADSELVWNKFVPLKINIFAWRLLSNRLPTKSNLIVRCCLHNESAMCANDCGVLDDFNHLFSELCFFWFDLG
jgi:hypothetical protein